MSTKLEGDLYTIGLVKPTGDEKKPLSIITLVDADENSYLTAIQNIIKMVHIDFRDLDLDQLNNIMQTVENGTFNKKEFLHYDLIDFGLFAGWIMGPPEIVKNIPYADYSDTEYFNIYDLPKQ